MATKKNTAKRASLNLNMGLVGLIALIVLMARSPLSLPEGIDLGVGLLLVVVLTVMFFTRRSDEYTLELWSAGANAAFGVMLLSLTAGPFAEGFIEGFNAAHDGREPSEEFDYSLVPNLAIIAFFLTFNIKRLLGAF